MTNIEITYSYIQFPGDESFLIQRAFVNNKEAVNAFYSRYFCAWLSTDIDYQGCTNILKKIDEIERGEYEVFHGGGNAWFVNIYRDYVRFELQTADDDPDWPVWTCSLGEVKAALIKWAEFLQLPRSLDSKLIVQLPPP